MRKPHSLIILACPTKAGKLSTSRRQKGDTIHAAESALMHLRTHSMVDSDSRELVYELSGLCYYVSMRVIKTSDIVNEAGLNEVVDELKAGGIVAFPTETFYGLGVIWSDAAALARLFRVKRRPKDKPVPLIIGDIATLSTVARAPEKIALSIIERFWPGPLTILFAAKAGMPELITGGTGKVALRVPGRSFALDVAKAAETPITATSANISGKAPARLADEVISYFGEDIDLVIDGGNAPGERPSTIIDMSGGTIRLVREGVISYKEILEAAKGL